VDRLAACHTGDVTPKVQIFLRVMRERHMASHPSVTRCDGVTRGILDFTDGRTVRSHDGPSHISGEHQDLMSLPSYRYRSRRPQRATD
jgi:hypothetical protein